MWRIRKKDVLVENVNLGKVKFTGKRNPPEGVTSIAIGVITVVIFLALSIVSAVNDGKGAMWIGIVGCVAAVGNMYALYLAVKALRMEDVYHALSKGAVAVNACMVIGYVVMYMVGALA